MVMALWVRKRDAKKRASCHYVLKASPYRLPLFNQDPVPAAHPSRETCCQTLAVVLGCTEMPSSLGCWGRSRFGNPCPLDLTTHLPHLTHARPWELKLEMERIRIVLQAWRGVLENQGKK